MCVVDILMRIYLFVCLCVSVPSRDPAIHLSLYFLDSHSGSFQLLTLVLGSWDCLVCMCVCVCECASACVSVRVPVRV